MKSSLQAVRGMNDVVPEEVSYWQYLEQCIRDMVARYSYQEIRLPLVEKTALFKRAVGEVTDIVEKEMYTFVDRNDESLSLRPEGTAGCVRAGIEQGLLYNQIQRLWYLGPMFRRERPQKGRYRQFQQFGLEAFGIPGPAIDAELILLTARLWQQLGLQNQVVLQLNSLGTLESRENYKKKLVDYLQTNKDELDKDSQRRLETNPLRILDSKVEQTQQVLNEAPDLLEFIDVESAEHFRQLRLLLDNAGIEYQVNSRLVRGLDYYNRTVFEWITSDLGAQGTLCAGGRYDGLVELLGGKFTPAVGFAMGLERVVLMLMANDKEKKINQQLSTDAYLICMGEQALARGLQLAEELRTELPTLCLTTHCSGGSFKSQLKQADKSGAKLALILGEEELANETVTIKFLRQSLSQETVKLTELKNTLHDLL